ncbi:MAG: hypothetical protein PVG51_15030 [Desulfosarcina sp.]|jgi:rubrerythrin
MKPRNDPSTRSTRQILESAMRQHEQLSRHWETARSAAGKPDTKMLLDYIRRKENGFVDMVSRYLAHAPDEILDTYFQFTPEEAHMADRFEIWQPERSDTVAEIIDAVLQWDAVMEKYYRRAAQMASREALRDMFLRLADGVIDKQKAQAQNASWLRDL